ncbi:hypothetical protein ACRALDRAFT_1076080 [Sodiomyces alcalophilus JCM 7366]|uniref:uncharacterized protein n=1 Tax=Sodiomyces alcalophilus JCM 7366 TaxID=591952 RepID=UPI0039B393F4
MPPREKRGGENSKKAAGLARKQEAAAAKAAEAEAKKAAIEDSEWSKGSKNTSKKEAEAAKKAEAARKKAERDALLREEEASNPSRSTPKKSKTATKKTRGLDLSQLDDDGGKALPALNASGLDDALDALALTGSGPGDDKIEKRPERRFKGALAAFEQRRLQEMESDGSGQGLRLAQRKERIRKEFEKSPENPFNQLTARYDATKEELDEIREREKQKIESRLGAKG